jgi:hypothetical protein
MADEKKTPESMNRDPEDFEPVQESPMDGPNAPATYNDPEPSAIAERERMRRIVAEREGQESEKK